MDGIIDNIVSLQELKERTRHEPLIWTCECGGRTFHLYDNGSVRCNSCDELSNSILCFRVEDRPNAG